MDVDLPSQALWNRWADVEADLETTADELRAEDWTVVALHPGDVTTRAGGDGGPSGLDVMVAGNEFAALEARLEAGASFEETAVFRQAGGGVMFLVCVLRDPDRSVAVVFPAFYPQRGKAAQSLAEQAHAAGALDVFVHPLGRERVVTITIEDPGLVFPSD